MAIITSIMSLTFHLELFFISTSHQEEPKVKAKTIWTLFPPRYQEKKYLQEFNCLFNFGVKKGKRNRKDNFQSPQAGENSPPPAADFLMRKPQSIP